MRIKTKTKKKFNVLVNLDNGIESDSSAFAQVFVLMLIIPCAPPPPSPRIRMYQFAVIVFSTFSLFIECK